MDGKPSARLEAQALEWGGDRGAFRGPQKGGEKVVLIIGSMETRDERRPPVSCPMAPFPAGKEIRAFEDWEPVRNMGCCYGLSNISRTLVRNSSELKGFCKKSTPASRIP